MVQVYILTFNTEIHTESRLFQLHCNPSFEACFDASDAHLSQVTRTYCLLLYPVWNLAYIPALGEGDNVNLPFLLKIPTGLPVKLLEKYPAQATLLLMSHSTAVCTQTTGDTALLQASLPLSLSLYRRIPVLHHLIKTIFSHLHWHAVSQARDSTFGACVFGNTS